MLDAVKNFAKATVSTGYDASATSVVLSSGHGARFPAVPFNATWWNSTDYADPADDPNVEIVRVTGLSTDTLTVTRGQDGTSASTKNTGGKTYKLLSGVSKLTIDQIRSGLAPTLETLTYGGTTDLPFTALPRRFSLALTGNITFTGSGYADAREIQVFVTGDSVLRTLAFPTSWKFVGAKPADIAANKVAVLSLQCLGSAEADVRAAWGVQA